MEGTVNKAAGLVFLLCRCGDRDFHVYLYSLKAAIRGVPAVAQWDKNQTTAAQVSAEARVLSPAWHSGLKDPVLP